MTPRSRATMHNTRLPWFETPLERAPQPRVFTERDPDGTVPEHWLAVLEAVMQACAVERADSAPTGLISRRIPGASGPKTARARLRVLRRHGYLYTSAPSADGAPLRWGLTPAGRALMTLSGARRQSHHGELHRYNAGPARTLYDR